LPDLFVGRPLIVTGRFEGAPRTIRVEGTSAGRALDVTPELRTSAVTGDAAALPSVWARMKIAQLSARSVEEHAADLSQAIRKVALDYNLMSPYTAFLAVDATRKTEGATTVTVPVAVPLPEGVNYEKTIEP